MVLLALKLTLLQNLDLYDSRYPSKRAALEDLEWMSPNEVKVPLSGEELSHALSPPRPEIGLPFFHEVIYSSFLPIISCD